MAPGPIIFLLKAAEVKGKGGTREYYYTKGWLHANKQDFAFTLVLRHMTVDHTSTK